MRLGSLLIWAYGGTVTHDRKESLILHLCQKLPIPFKGLFKGFLSLLKGLKGRLSFFKPFLQWFLSDLNAFLKGLLSLLKAFFSKEVFLSL